MSKKQEQEVEGMNWADAAYIALALPLVLVTAVEKWLTETVSLLVVHSKAIDRRKAFARQAQHDIETLTGGTE